MGREVNIIDTIGGGGVKDEGFDTHKNESSFVFVWFCKTMRL